VTNSPVVSEQDDSPTGTARTSALPAVRAPQGHGLPGLLVVFEGGEGVGKSTQIARLIAHLERTRPSRQVLQSREPGGTPAAEALRRIALDPEFEGLAARAEALVFAAARSDHAHRVIRPALAAGALVVLDRYIDSSVVYQGMARGLGAADVEALSMWATEGLAPDLVFVLDLDPSIGLARVARPDRMESAGLEFHHRVREGFLERAASDPGRYRVIDASAGIGEVAEQIAAHMDAVLDG